MKLVYSGLILVLLLFSGCSKEGIIEEEKFVRIYSDLLVAGDTTSFDSAKNHVFNRYSISSGDYSKTVNYYNSDPEKWEPFFDKVIAHIEELKNDSSSVY